MLHTAPTDGGRQMMGIGTPEHGVRRMCIAFDLEKYSSGIDAAQVEKQRALAAMAQDASERGALGRASWLRQAQGDGELALLPPGVDEAHVIVALWREFREGLHRYNRYATETARLRLRIAIHEGQTYAADNGFAGDAINTVCRLRDCAEAKAALRDTESDLVLIVSDRIFDDVIRGYDASDLPAAQFRVTHIDLPDKEFATTAFIFSDCDRGSPTPKETVQGAQAPDTGASRTISENPGGTGTTISIGRNANIRDVAGVINNELGR
jgi:hypothetical protein